MGAITQSNLRTLYERHPDALFFIMVRDIRDVFASMRNKGNFSYTAVQAATLWKNRIIEFREFVASNNSSAMEIKYEELVEYPEKILLKVCEFAKINYSSQMINYHDQNLSLFQNPHGHLSCEQLKKGLNDTSIGRWKSELSPGDVESITDTVGDMLYE